MTRYIRDTAAVRPCDDCGGTGRIDVSAPYGLTGEPGPIVIGWVFCDRCEGEGVVPDIHGLRAV